MPTCFLLTDVSDNEIRQNKTMNAVAVFKQLEFNVKVVGREVIDQDRADNLETQVGSANGLHIDYADHVTPELMKSAKGDVIIALEEWHELCFKNTLIAEGGYCGKAPVIELWVDYPGSFSPFRIFASRFAFGHACAAAKITKYPDKWVYAPPLVPTTFTAHGNLEIKSYNWDASPFNMDFLMYAGQGVPIVAPDWGIFSETLQHGVSGYLYRTEEGKQKAIAEAKGLSSAKILLPISKQFNIGIAAAHVAKYLKRVLHA